MDWCGYSSPKFKFPSFGIWRKLDNQYSWPTSSVKRSRLPTPRDVPFSLYWKIYRVSGPKWLELPSFTNSLTTLKTKFLLGCFSSDACGHFCWCQLYSPQRSSSFSYRDGWLSGLQEWLSITYAYGWSRPCLWLWTEQQLSVSCIQQHSPLVPPTENQGTWKIVYLFQNAANCSPTEIEK